MQMAVSDGESSSLWFLADGGFLSSQSKTPGGRWPRRFSSLVMSGSWSWQFSWSFLHHHKMAASVLGVRSAFKGRRTVIRAAPPLPIDSAKTAKHFSEAPSGLVLAHHWPKSYHVTTPSPTPNNGGKGEVWEWMMNHPNNNYYFF